METKDWERIKNQLITGIAIIDTAQNRQPIPNSLYEHTIAVGALELIKAVDELDGIVLGE